MARRNLWKHSATLEEPLTQAKIKLCWAIRRSMARSERTTTELAARLGTSRACVSRVQGGRTGEVTFNQLFLYLAILEPNFEILVSI